jgi:hypothetical protein
MTIERITPYLSLSWENPLLNRVAAKFPQSQGWRFVLPPKSGFHLLFPPQRSVSQFARAGHIYIWPRLRAALELRTQTDWPTSEA